MPTLNSPTDKTDAKAGPLPAIGWRSDRHQVITVLDKNGGVWICRALARPGLAPSGQAQRDQDFVTHLQRASQAGRKAASLFQSPASAPGLTPFSRLRQHNLPVHVLTKGNPRLPAAFQNCDLLPTKAFPEGSPPSTLFRLGVSLAVKKWDEELDLVMEKWNEGDTSTPSQGDRPKELYVLHPDDPSGEPIRVKREAPGRFKLSQGTGPWPRTGMSMERLVDELTEQLCPPPVAAPSTEIDF